VAHSDSWLDYLTAFSTAIAAFGTLAAVLVTLYFNVWRESRRRPSLFLEPYEETEFGIGWNPGERQHDDIWGTSLLVGNRPGRITAHDTQVLATFAYKLDNGEWYDHVSDQPLVWKYSRIPDAEGSASIDIPAGVKRKVFVVFIGEPNVLYRTLWPREPKFGGFADDDGCEIRYGDNGEMLTASPPIAGVLATYPFTQEDPFWFWRDEAYRLRLTLTSHDSDAVTFEAFVRFEFTRRREDEPGYVSGQDYIQPVWTDFRRARA
jgi:hypothetical protein